MPVERKDPSQFFCTGDDFDPEKAADIDFKIRSGMCPNSCERLLQPAECGGYECPGCNFWTNSRPEAQTAN